MTKLWLMIATTFWRPARTPSNDRQTLRSGRTSTVAPYAYGFRLDGDRIGWYEYRSKGAAFLAQAHRFSDVPPNHPLYSAIEDLARRGIVAGFSDGNFRPSGPLTRQQFAKMIVKTLGFTVTGNESCRFADVDSGVDPSDPFYPDKYVAVCALIGITQGKTPTTFAPYDNITRAQLLTMVVRAAARMGILDDPSPAYYLGTSDGTHFFRTWDDPDHARSAQTAEFNGLLDGLVLDDSSSLPGTLTRMPPGERWPRSCGACSRRWTRKELSIRVATGGRRGEGSKDRWTGVWGRTFRDLAVREYL